MPQSRRRLDIAGAENVGPLERQRQQGRFGLALHPHPHGPALFGAVGAGARNVAKGHLGVKPHQRFGHVQGEVVRDPAIVGLLGAQGGDAQAEVAGVVAG